MDWKAFVRKLLFPPVWRTVLLCAVSAVLLTAVFIYDLEQTVLAYAVYVLAFYALSVLCIFSSKVLPKQFKNLRQAFLRTAFGSRYAADPDFRRSIALHLSFVISLLYAGTHLWSWFRLKSWWFMLLTVYYGILAVMRFLLVRYVRRNRLGSSLLQEWKRARLCAWILLLVNLTLSGAVLMILYQNKGYDYPGILIYVMALYTFYSTVHAIIEILRCRKTGSAILSAAQTVSLCAALVSMLNLETAMFAQFGRELSPENQRIFIILTGAGVSAAVVTMSVLLILSATKEIRRERYGK